MIDDTSLYVKLIRKLLYLVMIDQEESFLTECVLDNSDFYLKEFFLTV